MHPGLEPRWVAQRPKLAPAADEALLDRLFARVAIPQDAAGDGIQPVVQGRGEGIERLSVACLGADHELGSQPVAPRRVTDDLVRLPSMTFGRSQTLQGGTGLPTRRRPRRKGPCP